MEHSTRTLERPGFLYDPESDAEAYVLVFLVETRNGWGGRIFPAEGQIGWRAFESAEQLHLRLQDDEPRRVALLPETVAAEGEAGRRFEGIGAAPPLLHRA